MLSVSLLLSFPSVSGLHLVRAPSPVMGFSWTPRNDGDLYSKSPDYKMAKRAIAAQNAGIDGYHVTMDTVRAYASISKSTGPITDVWAPPANANPVTPVVADSEPLVKAAYQEMRGGDEVVPDQMSLYDALTAMLPKLKLKKANLHR